MLRPYQIDAANFLAATPRSLLLMPMGTGKSLTTLTSIDNLSLTENVFPVLVVAPLRVAKSTWPGEVKKWPHLGHLKVSVITGKPKKREAALARKADIYCINFEGIKWLLEKLGDRWPFKMLVVDESTRLKGFRTKQGAKRAAMLAKVAFKSKRFVGLTGTPAPNGLQDLWGQIFFCDAGERLGRSYTAFENRWFRSEPIGDNAFARRLSPFDHSQKQIEDRISDITFSLNAKDHFDISDPIVNIIRVDLPEAARDLYDEMFEEFIVDMEAGEVEAVNAAVKTQKCLQLANGFIYVDEKRNFEITHEAKLDALESVVEEACGMPVLVSYAFKADLAMLKKRFPKGVEIGKDTKTIEKWNKGEIPLMFVHPKSAGHGLNLQYGSNILAFYSIDWNLEERLQVIERIGPVRQAQAGLDRPVFLHYLIAEDTLDEVVLARVDAKKTVMETLVENLKIKRLTANSQSV